MLLECELDALYPATVRVAEPEDLGSQAPPRVHALRGASTATVFRQGQYERLTRAIEDRSAGRRHVQRSLLLIPRLGAKRSRLHDLHVHQPGDHEAAENEHRERPRDEPAFEACRRLTLGHRSSPPFGSHTYPKDLRRLRRAESDPARARPDRSPGGETSSLPRELRDGALQTISLGDEIIPEA
jgi:hypothetical protein